MTDITIDKGVPVPAGGKGVAKYPFRELQIGDSFFVPGKVNTGQAAKNLGHRYLTRKRTEEGVEGIRVWRIE